MSLEEGEGGGCCEEQRGEEEGKVGDEGEGEANCEGDGGCRGHRVRVCAVRSGVSTTVG